MKNLWKRETKWKYLINLAGQEYPLQTMQDLVKILKVFNGANSLGTLARRNLYRFQKNVFNVPKRKDQYTLLLKGDLLNLF